MRFAIKLVWGPWKDAPVVGLSNAAYERWKDEIGVGTRLLIYETARNNGLQALVGEVRVTRKPYKDSVNAPTKEHDWLMDIETIRSRDQITPVSVEQIRGVLNKPKFPHQGEALTPISEEQYRTLIKLLDEQPSKE